MARNVVIVDENDSDVSMEASSRIAKSFSPTMIDSLLQEAESEGTPLDGPDGLLAQMTKAVLERALGVEMTTHLGYEHGAAEGTGTGNSRNGTGKKTVSTVAGPVDIQVPRDRNSTFEPRIVPKHARRLGNINDMILCAPRARRGVAV